MGKLLFFSDIHMEHDGSRENGLESIVQTANEEGVDKLVFGGDIIANGSLMAAKALEKNYGVGSAESYKALSAMQYDVFDKIVSSFNGEKHAIHGNHDPAGIHEVVKSMDFNPTDEIGKVYLNTFNTDGSGAELRYFNEGWQDLENGENEDHMNHARQNKPPIMLWHQGPHDQSYGQKENGEEIKYECPDEFKKIGEDASINLYGHNHGSYVKYDAKKNRFDINMTTQDGYFAIVEYDESHNPLACEVYRVPEIADNKADPQAGGQRLYQTLAQRIEESMNQQGQESQEESDPGEERYVA